MTLPFSTHWPSKMPSEIANSPNQFVEKIWRSLPGDIVDKEFDKYLPKLQALGCPLANSFIDLKPKIHTIRKGHRFKEGDWIHPVIYNRTKNRFQFAPTFGCTGIQTISITYGKYLCDWYGSTPTIFIDGGAVDYRTIERLAIADGFPDIKSFIYWFDQDIEGQIIHWTNTRYQ
ncbi:hypothetical protein [Galbibacter marinus]|nr:hypothetical protein [Galbibacter marinus]